MNLYDCFGIPENASQEDIKRAYRKLALKYHPDRQKLPNAAEAIARFQEISNAYQTLSDPQLKAVYDQGLESKRNRASSSYHVAQNIFKNQTQNPKFTIELNTSAQIRTIDIISTSNMTSESWERVPGINEIKGIFTISNAYSQSAKMDNRSLSMVLEFIQTNQNSITNFVYAESFVKILLDMKEFKLPETTRTKEPMREPEKQENLNKAPNPPSTTKNSEPARNKKQFRVEIMRNNKFCIGSHDQENDEFWKSIPCIAAAWDHLPPYDFYFRYGKANDKVALNALIQFIETKRADIDEDTIDEVEAYARKSLRDLETPMGTNRPKNFFTVKTMQFYPTLFFIGSIESMAGELWKSISCISNVMGEHLYSYDNYFLCGRIDDKVALNALIQFIETHREHINENNLNTIEQMARESLRELEKQEGINKAPNPPSTTKNTEPARNQKQFRVEIVRNNKFCIGSHDQENDEFWKSIPCIAAAWDHLKADDFYFRYGKANDKVALNALIQFIETKRADIDEDTIDEVEAYARKSLRELEEQESVNNGPKC